MAAEQPEIGRAPLRLVVLSADIPYPPTSGGRVEIWRRLKALKAAGMEVGLICWYDKGRVPEPSPADRAALDEVCSWVTVVPIKRSPLELAMRVVRLWREPSHVAARRVTAPLRELIKQASEFSPDAVLLDGLYAGSVAMDIARALDCPMFYRSHNVEHLYMRAQFQRQGHLLAKAGLLANLIGLRRYENRVIAHSQVVFDISLDDQQYWNKQGQSHVEWVPPIVDAAFAGQLAQPSAVDLDVLYFGNLHTPNNVEGLRWFVLRVLPLLPDPALKICVAGSRPTDEVRELVKTDPRIRLVENPPDMAAVIASARVLVNPVQAGSGVNIKATEMLFSSAHLVSTTVGVMGLPAAARDCFAVADSADVFAMRICEALADGFPVAPSSRSDARALFESTLFPARVAAQLAKPVGHNGKMKTKTRPRIGVDFHGWTGIYQGSRSHLFGIYAEAVRMAPEIDFWFLAEEPERLQREWNVGKEPNARFAPVPKSHGMVRLFVHLPLAVARHRLDLLHVQYRIPPMVSRRCVVTIHDVLFETYPEYFSKFFTWQSKIFYRYSARRARQVLTVSDYSRQEIARCYSVDPLRVVVTPNGVDLRRFTPQVQPSDAAVLEKFGLMSAQYVLSVGRLEPRKNYPAVIKAFRAANRLDLTLALVGQRDFSYGAALAEVEAALADGFKVVILENVGDDALPVLMRHALAFLYLAFAEGFGMPPLEAMACGTPVIASNTTAIPEIIGDGGLLVDPLSLNEAALALESLVSQEGMRKELSQKAIARAELFTWRSAAEQLVQSFRASLPATGTSW